MIDAATTLGKVNALGVTVLSVVVIFLLPKSFNAAGFHLVVDGLVNDPDTHVEDSDFVMAGFLNALQFPNNNHFIIQFVMQIIEEYITAYGITF